MTDTHKAPDSLKSQLDKEPLDGTKIPKLSPTSEFIISSKEKPSLQINGIKGQPDMWKLKVGGIESQSAARQLKFERRTDYKLPGFTSPFKPKGVAASYLPKLTRAPRPSLFRVSGKAVTPLSEHIFGDDDRAVLKDYSYPWWCIGSVGSGTGTLIGPRLIITAAHCIDFSSRHSTIFTPGKNNLGNTNSLPSARVDAWLTGSESGNVCANDFAIGVLSEPLGLSHGWLGTRSFNTAWVDIPHFMHVGLRGGVMPSWQGGLSVEDVDDGPFGTMELETYCDSESGQSGGPLFANWDGIPYIVGVLSGYEEEFTYSFPLSFSSSHNVFAGGPGMVERVVQMRNEYD